MDGGPLDRVPPWLTFTGPPSPHFRPLAQVSGQVGDDRSLLGAQVLLRLDDEQGEARPAALDAAAGTFALELTLAAGVHTVFGEAIDAAGNRAAARLPLEVVDRLAPEVEVLAPGFAVQEPEVTFVIQASDDFAVAWVIVELPRSGDEPQPAAADPLDPSLWRLDARLLPGANPVRVVATDPSGNRGEVEGEVQLIDEVAPLLELTSPQDGLVIWEPEVVLAGRATDDRALAEVVVMIDGELPENGTFLPEAADGSFLLGLPLELGSHRLELLARDLAGNMTTIAPRTVTRRDPDAPSLLTLTVQPRLLLRDPSAQAEALATARLERAAGGPVADGTSVRFSVDDPAIAALGGPPEVATVVGEARLAVLAAGGLGATSVRAVAGGLTAEAPFSVVEPSAVEVTICHDGGAELWGADLLLSTAAGAAVQPGPPPAGAAQPAAGLERFTVRHGRELPLRILAAAAAPLVEPGPLLQVLLPLAGRPAAGTGDFVLEQVRQVTDGLGTLGEDHALSVCAVRNVAGDLPPVVLLDRPPAVVESPDLLVSGVVEDAALATVVAVLWLDGGEQEPLDLGPDGRFARMIRLSPGPHRIEVLAVDDGGRIGRDGFEVMLRLPDVAPVLELSGPPELVASARAEVRGTVGDDGGLAALRVEVRVGAAAPLPAALDAQGGFAVEVALEMGANLITVTARDAAGNTAVQSRTVRRVEDGGPPTVQILEPAEGALLAALPVELRARVEGGATRDVLATVTVDEAVVPARYSPFSRLVTARLELEPGERTIAVVVEDQLGRSARDTVTVTYAPPDDPPVLTIGEPREGARLAVSRVVLSGHVSDDLGLAGLRVEAALDSGPFVAGEVLLDGRWRVTLPVGLGEHRAQVRAIDSTGHRTLAAVGFQVVPPAVVVVELLHVGGPADGFNVDEDPRSGLGDPEPDNALFALAALANGQLDQALAEGKLLLLLEFAGLAALPGPG
ncbi:MAG: hypothetical protein FJ125_06625, partial [Deltaproteobacteria bacterium]|nr:hypothetical protein [Deltaproteobacteria bacterium]